jgi:excisionase family DNA binding protein
MGGTRRPSTPSAQSVETPARLLTRRETAEYLALPERTLAAWAYKGIGPRFYKVGRWTRYRAEDLREWLAGCAVENGGPQ